MSNQGVNVPKYLKSTYKMISLAYPNGIDESKYFPLMAVLYQYMSDRNLAEVIALFTGKKLDTVLNDVYRSQSTNKPRNDELESIKKELIPFGFEEWAEEDL
jgi:hypothetical protein